jgi:hypothetical protein
MLRVLCVDLPQAHPVLVVRVQSEMNEYGHSVDDPLSHVSLLCLVVDDICQFVPISSRVSGEALAAIFPNQETFVVSLFPSCAITASYEEKIRKPKSPPHQKTREAIRRFSRMP